MKKNVSYARGWSQKCLARRTDVGCCLLKKYYWWKYQPYKAKVRNATLFSICFTAINTDSSQCICKHGKLWSSLCHMYNHYQSWARLFSGYVCSQKIWAPRLLPKQNSVVWMFQSNVCRCFTAIKPSLTHSLWRWPKYSGTQNQWVYVELLPQASYSPDFAPSYNFLFPYLVVKDWSTTKWCGMWLDCPYYEHRRAKRIGLKKKTRMRKNISFPKFLCFLCLVGYFWNILRKSSILKGLQSKNMKFNNF